MTHKNLRQQCRTLFRRSCTHISTCILIPTTAIKTTDPMPTAAICGPIHAYEYAHERTQNKICMYACKYAYIESCGIKVCNGRVRPLFVFGIEMLLSLW